jgi:hypothetical protein
LAELSVLSGLGFPEQRDVSKLLRERERLRVAEDALVAFDSENNSLLTISSILTRK